jgi:hypothetical protein
MSDIENKEKMRWILFWVFIVIFIVITICTIILIFFDFGAVRENERDLLFKVFIGEVGLAIITLFYSLFGLKKQNPPDKKTIKKIDDAGYFANSFPKSQHPAFFQEVEKLIEKSKEITLIAIGLNLIWEKHIVDSLIHRAQTKKAKVTICLGNPFSPFVEDRLIEEEMYNQSPPVGKDGIERNIHSLIENLKAAGNPSQFEFKLFEHYPTCATLIFDNEIFIYPYGYHVLGNTSPIFHLKRNNSDESNFFLENAKRVLKDSINAIELYEVRKKSKYFNANWKKAAIYLIPSENDLFYKFGSKILGYDIRKEYCIPKGSTDIPANFIGEAKKYGFHATIVDVLYFCEESNIERIKAELKSLCKELRCINLTNLKFVKGFHSNTDLAITCKDESGIVEIMHHELISRINTTSISSVYKTNKTKKKFDNTAMRDKLMINRYGSPYILDKFKLHFTLLSDCPNINNSDNSTVNEIESGFLELAKSEIEIDEVCLVVQENENENWRIEERYQLKGQD